MIIFLDRAFIVFDGASQRSHRTATCIARCVSRSCRLAVSTFQTGRDSQTAFPRKGGNACALRNARKRPSSAGVKKRISHKYARQQHPRLGGICTHRVEHRVRPRPYRRRTPLHPSCTSISRTLRSHSADCNDPAQGCMPRLHLKRMALVMMSRAWRASIVLAARTSTNAKVVHLGRATTARRNC